MKKFLLRVMIYGVVLISFFLIIWKLSLIPLIFQSEITEIFIIFELFIFFISFVYFLVTVEKHLKTIDKDLKILNEFSSKNEENVISDNIKMLKLLKAIPGILTELGILGTFVGLTLGLNHVELGTADVNTLKQGIISLLSGISTAFLTSLFGIFFSILFLAVLNIELDSLSKEINKIAEKLNSIFPFKTSEEILYQVYQ